ncbi:ABC-2 type transport system ATP-binding protein [Lachnospiraceae bacterium PFB1-21]
MVAIEASHLSKVYDTGKEALKNLDFSLHQGEVFGFLGPNGAGKTTTIKLLTGLLTPSTGASQVLGVDPSAEPAKLHGFCGIMTEHAQMYNLLSGYENLLFYGEVFGLEKEKAKARALQLLERLELTDAMYQKLGTYSTGMRQRLSLARALLHSPQMLFLDEPTSGLDPESIWRVNDLIKEMAKDEGITVFLCTHQLRYAQEVCSTYGLIAEGELLAKGNLRELRALTMDALTLELKAENIPLTENSHLEKVAENRYEMKISEVEEIPAIVQRLARNGTSIYEVRALEQSLEDIYFALIKRKGEGHDHL